MRGCRRRRSSRTRSRRWIGYTRDSASAHRRAAAHCTAPERTNSRGVNFADGAELRALKTECEAAAAQPWQATALIDGKPGSGETLQLANPSNESQIVGSVAQASAADAERAVTSASAAQPEWDAMPAEQRAAILLRAADAFEANRGEFLARCTLEAGKTLADGIAEVREAVDFLRYYAAQARAEFGEEKVLRRARRASATRFGLRGRGVFACISPWNFPLAIFTGQVARGARGRQRGASRSRPSRRRSLPRWPFSCCTRRVCRRRCCSSCRATAAPSARRSRAIRASPASRSPAPRTRRGSSSAASPRAPAASPR